jgi:hypothetical protein
LDRPVKAYLETYRIKKNAGIAAGGKVFFLPRKNCNVTAGLFAASATKAVIQPRELDRFRLVLNDLKIMHQCLPKKR